MSGNRVITAGMQGMAAKNPLYRHPDPLDRTMPLNRFDCIRGAGRIESAGVCSHGRRDEPFVEAKKKQDHPGTPALVPASKWRRFFMSASTSLYVGNGCVLVIEEEYRKTSASGFDSCFNRGRRIALLTLYASRRSLLRRFRSTALFRLPGAVNPTPDLDPSRSLNRSSARTRQWRYFP